MADIIKFIEAIRELFLKADFTTLVTVLVGVAIGAGTPAYWIGRLRQKLKDPSAPAPLPPVEPPPHQVDPMLIAELEKCRSELALAGERLKNLDRLTAALERPDEELWRFHQAEVPRQLIDRIRASGMKVLVFANLKGGVGKTTTAANLAAYFERLGHQVLLIDFDYQGSLSKTVLRAAERPEVASVTDLILTGSLTGAQVAAPGYCLAPKLPSTSLLPAGYELNRQENRMLTRWLLRLDDLDPRFALARVLASPEVTAKFKIVIIDTPPRLTLATVNALCAGTHLIVPTILDGLSIENVGGFLKQAKRWFKAELNPELELAGIVGTMTAEKTLNNVELAARDTLIDAGLEAWGDASYIFAQHIPDTSRFREDAGTDIAYLDQRKTNEATRQVIIQLGQEIATRIKL